MNINRTYSIPDYRLIKRISQTGMSSVYLAESLTQRKPIVVKILDYEQEETVDTALAKRFELEYELLKAIEHPNIAGIYGYYEGNGFSCILMEYFPGGNLSVPIASGLDSFRAINYLRQLAFALEEVHSHNIVHRDIKPRNILIREDGTLALSDFGIARIMGKSFDLTLQGMIMGSPYYMSPEQINNSELDQRSDLYSLGAVFYEMLTGKKAYREETLMKIFYAHLNDPVPQLPVLLQPFQPIIDRLMAKRPKDRFQDTSELLEALYHCPTPVYRTAFLNRA